MATYATGLLVITAAGQMYLVEYGKKRLIPDKQTLNTLTLNLGEKLLIPPTDNTFDALPLGQAFPSLTNAVATYPQLVPYIYNVVYKLIPAGGIVKLPGGMTYIVNAVANMYAAAVANPSQWGVPAGKIPHSGAGSHNDLFFFQQMQLIQSSKRLLSNLEVTRTLQNKPWMIVLMIREMQAQMIHHFLLTKIQTVRK